MSSGAHEAPNGFGARDNSAAADLLAARRPNVDRCAANTSASGCGEFTEAVHRPAARLPNQETYRSMGATSYKRKSPLTCRPPFSNDAGPEFSRCYGGPAGGPAVLATSRLK